jgi:hypothetical protein
MDVYWYSTLQSRVPVEMISRISSYDWLGSVALSPIGYALIAPVAQLWGVSRALAGAAGLTAAAAVYVAFSSAIAADQEDASRATTVPTALAAQDCS